MLVKCRDYPIILTPWCWTLSDAMVWLAKRFVWTAKIFSIWWSILFGYLSFFVPAEPNLCALSRTSIRYTSIMQEANVWLWLKNVDSITKGREWSWWIFKHLFGNRYLQSLIGFIQFCFACMLALHNLQWWISW